MKIHTTTRACEVAPLSYTRVVFTEGTTTKFVERADGSTALMLGVGSFAKVTTRSFRLICRNIVQTARSSKLRKLAVQVEPMPFPALSAVRDQAWIVATLAENFLLANYEYTAYKSKRSRYALEEILVCGSLNAAVKRGLERGITVGECVNLGRDIANTPGGDMTPALLAARARAAVRTLPVKVTVFDEKRIAREKMGALLAVGKGAKDKPRFIILEYWGAKRGKSGERPLVFAGKGITFDTGGLNVKPGDSMLDMHLDMSGGATVIAALTAAARLRIPRNIVGLIPAAENAISGESFRPGDVITTLSGKTVDVLNTDAEGRLVLADALTYATRYNPRLVIDVATLTGAAIIALGEHASALLTKDDGVRERLMTLGEESGDYLWPLPLWSEYQQYTKGRFGDIANIPSSGNTRAGGVIHGGMFLSHFTDTYPSDCGWAHIDMAPRMVSVPSDKLAKGSTGEPARFLIAVADRYDVDG